MAQYVEALYAYQAAEKNQLSLRPHEKIQVLERDQSGWWIGRNSEGNVGIFPSTYVKQLKSEKVFHKPKEMKVFATGSMTEDTLSASTTSTTTTGKKAMSRDEKLANDLGLDMELDSGEERTTSPKGDSNRKVVNKQEFEQLTGELAELRTKFIASQADRDIAMQRMEELQKESQQLQEKLDTARTQLNVLKKTSVTMHEKERRMLQEIEDMKLELADAGKSVREYKYECTPDEAIGRFLASSLGTLKQEFEELKKENTALKSKLDTYQKRAMHFPTSVSGTRETSASPTPMLDEKLGGDMDGNQKPEGLGAGGPGKGETSAASKKSALATEGDGEPSTKEDGEATAATVIDPKEHAKVQARYKKLETEYKKIRRENKELKAQLEGLEEQVKATATLPTQPPPPVPTETPEEPPKVDYPAKVQELTTQLEQSQGKIQDLTQTVSLVQEQLDQTLKDLESERAATKETTSATSELKAKVRKLDAKRKEEIAQLQQQVGELTESNQKLTEEATAMKAEKDVLANLKKREEEEFQALRAEIERLQGLLRTTIADKDAQYDEIVKKYKQEERKRRQLYNELQELRGNIRVYCRCKPVTEEESPTVVTVEENGGVRVVDEESGKLHSFELDVSYDAVARQEQVFSDVKPLATSVLDGYNVCIFAYGQTGSGKTYTMEGPADNRGVNYRTVEELFRLIQGDRVGVYKTMVRIGVIEVYNEVIYDLLNKRNRLEVHYSEKQGVTVPEMVVVECQSVTEVNEAMLRGSECRRTASTNMNEYSSRSHCLLSVFCETTNVATGQVTNGKLHLVDLAGSERLQRTGATSKDRIDEARNINTSLTHLGMVINSLANKKEHIPYRNSTLTRLLQDSLGGNCKCLMFANISMVRDNVGETISTLKFASGVRQVELGKAEKVIAKKSGLTTSASASVRISFFVWRVFKIIVSF